MLVGFHKSTKCSELLVKVDNFQSTWGNLKLPQCIFCVFFNHSYLKYYDEYIDFDIRSKKNIVHCLLCVFMRFSCCTFVGFCWNVSARTVILLLFPSFCDRTDLNLKLSLQAECWAYITSRGPGLHEKLLYQDGTWSWITLWTCTGISALLHIKISNGSYHY